MTCTSGFGLLFDRRHHILERKAMHILKVLLTDGQPLSEIKVSPRIVDQSCVWVVEVNGTACVIRRDDAGSWMQQSSDNLSPEYLFRLGQAIESLFVRPGGTDR